MQRLDRARQDQGEQQRERDGHEGDVRLVQQEPERAPRQGLDRRHGFSAEALSSIPMSYPHAAFMYRQIECGAARQIANLYTSIIGDWGTIVRIPDEMRIRTTMSNRFESSGPAMSKVPAVTLGFWLIKILATTLGETGGDTVTMTMNLGYLAGTAIFLSLLVVLVAFQIRARSFHPALYWATIVASTTAGTTLADFADRSLGIGYHRRLDAAARICVLGTLGLWYRSQGTVSVDTVHGPRRSRSIGPRSHSRRRSVPRSAIGWRMTPDSATWAVRWSSARRWRWSRRCTSGRAFRASCLFWVAFILTRPLGATLGDFLDKPLSDGGLALSRPIATAVIGAAIIVCVLVIPQRAGAHPNSRN